METRTQGAGLKNKTNALLHGFKAGKPGTGNVSLLSIFMKSNYILLMLAIVAIVSAAFTPSKTENPTKIEAKVTWTEKVAGVSMDMEKTYLIAPSQRDKFMNDIFKSFKIDSFCQCTVSVVDANAGHCVTRCCAWGGMDVGEVCIETSHDCCAAPQTPCD